MSEIKIVRIGQKRVRVKIDGMGPRGAPGTPGAPGEPGPPGGIVEGEVVDGGFF